MNTPAELDLTKLPWRVGRKVGRTVYAQVGEKPSEQDLLIGLFDTQELAAEAVRSHNQALDRSETSLE